MRRNTHSSKPMITTIAFHRRSINLVHLILSSSLVALVLIVLAIAPAQLFVQHVQAQFGPPAVNGAIVKAESA